MNKHIYSRLAATNLKKNHKIYLPYLLTLIGSILFYYILTSLGTNPLIYDLDTRTEAFYGASTLCAILQSGSFVSYLFALIFLFYANSFVLKHQKKQLGLYRVLGMERRHIIRIILLETISLFGTGLLVALFFGIFLDKLMLVLLFQITHQPMPEGFSINISAIFSTLLLTGLIAALILLRGVFSILRTKDIDLLKSEKKGEREPKNRLLLAIAGFVLLGIGYYYALTCHGVNQALSNFFPAALCVILGTYALFTAGSIAILKILKRNKKYYYSTRHFISLSGMLYRMKQNAAGLSNICILSAAAIVVISAGVCLYSNGNRSITEQFPRSVQFYADGSQMGSTSTLEEIFETTAKETKLSYENFVCINYGNAVWELKENKLLAEVSPFVGNLECFPDTYILTLEEYNRCNNTSETLKENEILLYDSDNILKYDTLIFDDTTYQIKNTANAECLTYIANYSMSLFPKFLMVVPDKNTFDSFFKNDSAFAGSVTYVGFDVNGSSNDIQAFANNLSEALNAQNIANEMTLRLDEESFFYATYGGLFFVGVVLGALFLICTVMIIYYKQISEGYEDRERFLIMQKVGLSKKEIKQSINSQIMLLFFLPLITAIIHSAVALNIVADCLRLVMIVHMPTFIASVAIVCVLFSVVYGIVYKITSREYYGIVNE